MCHQLVCTSLVVVWSLQSFSFSRPFLFSPLWWKFSSVHLSVHSWKLVLVSFTRCWFFSALMMVIPVLSLLVTMVTRCQLMWHLHPHLQLSSRSERCNHGDRERGELCVSDIRWSCRLLLCLAQRLLRQLSEGGHVFVRHKREEVERTGRLKGQRYEKGWREEERGVRKESREGKRRRKMGNDRLREWDRGGRKEKREARERKMQEVSRRESTNHVTKQDMGDFLNVFITSLPLLVQPHIHTH